MRRRISSSSAAFDELLDKDVADGSALSRVVAAARAPGTADELVGLSAAMSAFASVTNALPRTPVSHRAIGVATARRLAVKAVLAIGGVTLAGGAAYAASSGSFLGGPEKNVPAHHSPAPASDSHSAPGVGGGPAGPVTVDKNQASSGPRAGASSARTHVKTTGSAKANATHPAHPTHPPSPTHSPSSGRPSTTHPGPSSATVPKSHPAPPSKKAHPSHSPSQTT